MKSPQRRSIKKTIHQIDAQLAGTNVSEKKISTIGKALFEVSRVFQEIEKRK